MTNVGRSSLSTRPWSRRSCKHTHPYLLRETRSHLRMRPYLQRTSCRGNRRNMRLRLSTSGTMRLRLRRASRRCPSKPTWTPASSRRSRTMAPRRTEAIHTASHLRPFLAASRLRPSTRVHRWPLTMACMWTRTATPMYRRWTPTRTSPSPTPASPSPTPLSPSHPPPTPVHPPRTSRAPAQTPNSPPHRRRCTACQTILRRRSTATLRPLRPPALPL